jgi:hypothetical protein
MFVDRALLRVGPLERNYLLVHIINLKFNSLSFYSIVLCEPVISINKIDWRVVIASIFNLPRNSWVLEWLKPFDFLFPLLKMVHVKKY